MKLGEVCTPISNISNDSDFIIDYIDISSIDNNLKKITETKTMTLSNAPSRAKQITVKNDIIVSNVRPNLNAVAINNIESENIIVCSTGFSVLRCNEYLDYKYLFYFCISETFVQHLANIAKGSSYPAVVNDDVFSMPIPLPPLPEQRIIAHTIESKLANIEKARAAAGEELAAINALSSAFLQEAFRSAA